MAARSKKNFMNDEDPIGEGFKKAEGVTSGERQTLAEIDAEIFGGEITEAPRKPVRKIAIDDISPDPAQPRRTVPKDVLAEAKAAGVPVWQAWHRMAGRLVGKSIDLKTMLKGEGDGPESITIDNPLVDDFMDLVKLAASIYRDGLINPVSIFGVSGRYQLETGEGRWMSHQMLHSVLGEEKWGHIDALIVSKPDVWRQAAENGARRPLNAIGMARQLALLIMDLWRGKDGADFVPYGKMITDQTQSDRKFYAQVADGNIWRIPRGASERILQVTGLKSQEQIAQYRALLKLDDETWERADRENWKEFKIREHVNSLKPKPAPPPPVSPANPFGKSIQPNGPKNVTGAPMRWPLEGEGVRYMWHGGKKVQLESAELNKLGTMVARVWRLDENDQRTFAIEAPLNLLQDGPPYPSTPAAEKPEQTSKLNVIGKIYRHRNGRFYQITGTMMNDKAQAFEVDVTGNRKRSYTETLDQRDLTPLPGIPEWLRPGSLVIHDHDEERYRVKGNVKSLDFDNGRYLAKILANDEVYGPYGQERLRPGGGSEPGPETRNEDDSADGDDYQNQEAVSDDTPMPEKLHAHMEEMLHALYLDLPFDKSTRNATTRNSLKAYGLIETDPPNGGAWDVWVTPKGEDYLKAHDLDKEIVIEEGKAYTLRDGRYEGQWYLVEKVHPNGAINGHIVDAQGKRVHEVSFTFSAINLRLDPNHPYPAVDKNPGPSTQPPAWAVQGAIVQHIETGKICDVRDVQWSPDDGVWFVQVVVRENGVITDTDVREFEPYIEAAQAPREPHPSLRPENANSILFKDQMHVGLVVEMARYLAMQDDYQLLLGLKTLTSNGLRTRIRNADAQHVRDWLDTLETRSMAVLERMAALVAEVVATGKTVIEDIEAGA